VTTSFSEALTALMTERGISGYALARRVPCDRGLISRYVNAKQDPSQRMAHRLDEVLGAEGSLAALTPAQPQHEQPETWEALRGQAAGEEEEELERRRLLRDLAALGIVISPAAGVLDHIRGSVSAAFGHDDIDHPDDWDDVIREYACSYLASSPVMLVPDLAADLVSVRFIIGRLASQDARYRAWCRVGGALSGLMAKSLSNLGQARESRRWWTTALHVTDASGDVNLGLWVRGQRIIHGFYESRPARMLLHQAGAAADFGRGNICTGLADVSTARAQACVLSGDYDSAVADLGWTQEILSQLPDAVTEDTSSIMGWGEAQLRYTETWVYAHMGDEQKADQAASRALQLYPASDTRSPAQIRLMQAFTRIRSGDISEGIRHAQAVYEPLIAAQCTTMVDAIASRILDWVPAEAQDRPDVAAYRALVAPSSREMIES
jgi:transcriptional regulator with XRE-family HTH domain